MAFGIIVGMGRFVALLCICVLVASCSSSSDDTNLVPVTRTVVYTDSGMFDSDSAVDGSVCSPKSGPIWEDPSNLLITGGVITTKTLHEGTVGPGTLTGGQCVVEMRVEGIPKISLVVVTVGPIACSSSIAETSPGGGLSFGTLMVTDC